MKDIKEYGEGLFAEMKTTKGTMLIKLFYDKVPLTIANFVGLAEGTKDSIKGVGVKYYDGLTFHRVIPNFMIQGGDPAGNGTGGPGYSFEDEFDATLRHDKKGILSMANAGPNSNGSQFFITHVPTAWLDGKHTVFGEVVFGLDVVDAVQMGDKIESVVIHRNGDDVKNYKITQKEFDSIRKKVLSK